VRETAERGVIAGYPLSDFKATLFDGSFPRRGLERDELQDRGIARLQNCVKEAQPFLLEPIMNLEVLVPEEQMGDVLAASTRGATRPRHGGDRRRPAADQGARPDGGDVPLATDLRSDAGGRGTFSARCSLRRVPVTHRAEGDRPHMNLEIHDGSSRNGCASFTQFWRASDPRS